MKKLILLAACALVSFAAFAEPFVVWSDGQVVPYWPSAIYRADGSVETVRPTAEQCIAAGVARWETEAETAAREAAVAAANAEADAQAAAFDFPAPEVVVPVLDANGERTGTARLLVDSAGQIVVVTDTASPQRTAAVQIAEFKAKRDAASAKLAKAKAEANGQLQKRIENIESVLGIRE